MLDRADRAGDAEAARDIAVLLQGAPAPAPQQEDTSLGMEAAKAVPRGIGMAYEGLSDIVEAVPGAIGTAGRMFGANLSGITKDWDKDIGFMGRLQRGAGEAGLELMQSYPSAEAVTLDTAPFTRGLNETAGDRLRASAANAAFDTEALKRRKLRNSPVGEGVVSAIEIGSGALTPGGGLKTGVGRAATGLASLFGGAARTAAEYEGLDAGDTALAEAFGALSGGLSPALRNTPALARRASDGIGALWKRLTMSTKPSQQTKDDVARFIRDELMTNPDQSIPRLEAALARGDEGSLSTLIARGGDSRTGDAARVRGVEQMLPSVMTSQERDQAKRLLGAAGRRTEERATNIVESVAEGGTAAGATAPQAARQRQTLQRTRAAQERLTKESQGLTDEAARLEQAGVVPGPDELTASRRLAGEVEAGRSLTKAREADLWQKASKHTDSNMQTGGVKRAIDAVLDSEPKATIGALRANSSVNRVLNEINGLKANTPVKEVLEYKRQIRDEINAAVRRGDIPAGNLDRVTNRLVQAIDDKIMTTRRAPAVQRAIDASIDRFKFDTGLVGDIRKGVAKIDSPEVAGDLVGKARGAGARIDDLAEAERAAVKAGGSPTAITKATDDALRAQFRKATTPEALKSNPDAGQRWLNARVAALENRTELVDEFKQSIASLNKSRALSKTAAARADKAEQLGEIAKREGPSGKDPSTVWGRFASGNPVVSARKVLDGKEPVRMAQRLLNVAKKTGDPQDVKNLRAAFRDAFMEKAANQEGVLTKAARSSLEQTEKTLATVLDPEDMTKIKDAISLMDRMKGGAVVTDKDLSNILGAGNPAAVAAARLFGAHIGGKFGNPLIMASLASKGASRALSDVPRAQARRALLNYLANPAEFAAEVKVLGQRDVSTQAAKRAISNMISPTIAGTATAAQED